MGDPTPPTLQQLHTTMVGPASKIDWADDAAAEDSQNQRVEGDFDENGIKTVIEYRTDDQGRRVKVTRRIKRTLVTAKASPSVAQRHQWTKFGAEKGKKAGPDSSTTSLGSESMRIKLSVDKKEAEKEEQDESAKIKMELGGKKVSCRLCQGDHFTARCPYKDTLGDIDDAAPPEIGEVAPGDGATGPGGKYVPPSMRAGARGPGESMHGVRGRDDYPTLRVTNLAEDTEEDDLRNIFERFGRVHRAYVGRDQVTGLCKGFAFVSFEDRAQAENAMKKVDGMPFAHLILSCQWSVPKEKP